ncbi:hypothetical protein LCGC14_2965270 [marine sediment metagenome]|uniref:Uncharacterized protein n=1 Tax=marine sediment metagenome TaxID=412755 RepID=A0A0F8XBW5_9ZZZZ
MSESKKPTVSEIRAFQKQRPVGGEDYEPSMSLREIFLYDNCAYLLDLVERMGDTLGRFSSEFPVPGCGYCTITIKPDGKVNHEDSCPIPEARGLLKETKHD